MMPGEIVLPDMSMRRASAGICTRAPTALMRLPSTKTVPRSTT
jgi:hypothetical protein